MNNTLNDDRIRNMTFLDVFELAPEMDWTFFMYTFITSE